jgi:HD-GYP domain-containing protein (c-di-GMP phosphodiesterase class II)
VEANILREEFLKLNQIGIALTSIHDLDQLLEMIVREARGFTGADAGSIYLRENDSLRFVVSQCQTLKNRLGEDAKEALFSSFVVPIDKASMAGFVASTKQNLNIPDVYAIADTEPYSFNPDFDKRNNYLTKSALSVPMLDHKGEILGVLQLINAIQNGKVIAFPTDKEDLVRSLASQAAVAVNNARLTSEIKRVHLDTIYRLSVAAEYKDKDTAQHIRRMSNYSAALAKKMGWNNAEAELLLYAAPMHDVGKIGIADAILLKPGRLTDEERKTMQEHTTIGAKIMSGSDSDLLKLGELVARCHHEKYDGSGYPRGLKGDDIPMAGRIVAVADVFDALSSRRVYKDALALDDTLSILQQDAGTHFDPECVDNFCQIMDEISEIKQRYQDKDAS